MEGAVGRAAGSSARADDTPASQRPPTSDAAQSALRRHRRDLGVGMRRAEHEPYHRGRRRGADSPREGSRKGSEFFRVPIGNFSRTARPPMVPRRATPIGAVPGGAARRSPDVRRNRRPSRAPPALFLHAEGACASRPSPCGIHCQGRPEIRQMGRRRPRRLCVSRWVRGDRSGFRVIGACRRWVRDLLGGRLGCEKHVVEAPRRRVRRSAAGGARGDTNPAHRAYLQPSRRSDVVLDRRFCAAGG